MQLLTCLGHAMESELEYYVQLKKRLQNSPVKGWGGLSQNPNVKLSRNCLIFPVMYSMSNVKVKQVDYGWGL